MAAQTLPITAVDAPRAGPVGQRVRAVRRLVAMLAKTAWHGSRAAWRARSGERLRADEVTGQWARSVIRALGVRPVVHGSFPSEATVVVANHRSYLDIPLLAAARPTVFLAKAEIAGWPLIGRAAEAAGTVFVRRGDKASQTQAAASLQRLAQQGRVVTVFPEGTTTAGPAMEPLRPGMFRIAASTQVAVAPVAIVYPRRADAYCGNDRFLPHFLRAFTERRVRPHISFGRALRSDDPALLHATAERWLQRELARLEDLVRPA